MIIEAAPCAHVCVRGPVQKAAGGWPLNSVVRWHEMTKRIGVVVMCTVIAVAVAFNAWVAILEWSDFVTGGPWLIWACFPFVAAVIVAIISGQPTLGAVTSIVALALSVWWVYAIRTSPSSTAAIAYLWFPLWNLIVVLVLGTVGGLIWSKMSRRG